jgi:V-type H+-transporting ATPase subunit H
VEIPQVDQQVFIPWLKQQCEKSSPAERMIGLQALHQLLTVNDYKLIFWHLQGVEVLQHLAVAPKVDGPKHTQQLYLAVKCLWLLSYHEDIKVALNSPVMISNLVEILKSVSKDKIVRLTLSTLRNLMDIGKNAELMISYGIIRCLNLFLQKRWADEDIDADLAALQTYLEDKVNDLTSFDVYKYELLGMKLDWSSPVHRSERFWRTNVNRFDEDDYAALKQLRLILTSPDSSATVLAVASWDVGEIIRQHPQRKFVLQKVDLKTPVMALLHHPSEEVKKESLLALQKIMVTNWESLQ